MRIKIQQFLFGGTLWSWSVVGQELGRSFLKLGHDVEFISTDGVKPEYVPADLLPYIKQKPEGSYFLQCSYTAIHNFPHYLAHGKKNRFGIWNYDATVPPKEMIRFHTFCDKFCPSSDFSGEIFAENGIPKEKIHVIPHGINLEEFQTKEVYKLKTNKKRKILLNIATPHLRKNIKNTLKAYGEAFSKYDDVCLVIKISSKSKGENDKIFTVDFFDILRDFRKAYPDAAEIEMVRGFIPSLASLYNACDIVFMMSNIEMWHLPSLEALACNKLVIASDWGGQTHFLNKDNSFQIKGDIVRMPREYQYWQPSPYAKMISPRIDDAANKLCDAVENYDTWMEKLGPEIKKTAEKFTWDNAAKMLLDLAE